MLTEALGAGELIAAPESACGLALAVNNAALPDPILSFAKQVRHHRDALVTGMVQARKPKPRLKRFQQREAVVVAVTSHSQVIRIVVAVACGSSRR